MTVYKKMVDESILPNQIKMILVSFFSECNVLSDEIKICYIFTFDRAFRLFGTPGIVHGARFARLLLASLVFGLISSGFVIQLAPGDTSQGCSDTTAVDPC